MSKYLERDTQRNYVIKVYYKEVEVVIVRFASKGRIPDAFETLNSNENGDVLRFYSKGISIIHFRNQQQRSRSSNRSCYFQVKETRCFSNSKK